MSKLTAIFSRGGVKCAFCGTDLKKDELFCPNCGHGRDEAAASAPAEAGIVCHACGSPMEEGDRFCMNCGAKREDMPVEEPIIEEEALIEEEPVMEEEPFIEEEAVIEDEPIIEEEPVIEEPIVDVVEETPVVAMPSMYGLRFIAEPEREVCVLRSGAMIGRLATCSLVLDEPSISRKHCHIDYIGGQWCIVILGVNGLIIDGKHYTSEHDQPIPLADGCIIEFPGLRGNTAVQFVERPFEG